MARDGVLLLPTWFSRDLIDDVRLVFVFNAAFTVFIVLTVCLSSSSSSYLFASKHNISTSIQKYQRQAAREALTPINAGRPHN